MEVHETALVTCAFRAMHPELSKDQFAHLWHDDRVLPWAHKYLNRVSPEEAAAHSLRNRYFLDTLKKLVADNKIEYLVNFGAGFSMYPYLLSDQLRHIEIDLPTPLVYKQKQTEQWQETGKLPKRRIHYLPCDFNENFEEELYKSIIAIKKDAPCFILLEGVLFFLSEKETHSLFQLFNRIENTNDYIGSVSFRASDTQNKAFALLLDFMKEESPSANNEVTYQTVETEYYQNLEGYTLLDKQNFHTLSETYNYTPKTHKDNIINEQLYLLQKV